MSKITLPGDPPNYSPSFPFGGYTGPPSLPQSSPSNGTRPGDVPMMLYPPGGFGQMTLASKLALTGGKMGQRRRKKRKGKSTRSSKTAKRAKSTKRKLKFGSPAWQKKYRVGKFAKKKR